MHIHNSRIDSHVHFFTVADLQRVSRNLPYNLPQPHPLSDYLDQLIDSGITPALINNVHLSILPDSENVFTSFSELAALQARNPARYGAIRLVGTIVADPEYANAHRLAHPQVVGIRIVLHDAKPETVDPQAYSTLPWQALYQRLRQDQHVHIYAQEAETNLRVLRQLPEHLRVVIDHLGSCRSERGAQEPAYGELLAEAKRRGNVWFKGPGYRTAIDVEAVVPFVARIAMDVGIERLMLDATDAPHVGADPSGRRYAQHFCPKSAFAFVDLLAELAHQPAAASAPMLLRGSAKTLFPAL